MGKGCIKKGSDYKSLIMTQYMLRMYERMYVRVHVLPSAAPAELNPPKILFPAPPPPPPAPALLGDVDGPMPKKDDSLEVVEGGGVGIVLPLRVFVTCCVLKPWLLDPCVLPDMDPEDLTGAPVYDSREGVLKVRVVD